MAQAKAQFPASKRVPDVSAINGQQIAILMPPIIQLAMPFDAAITKPGARLTEVAVYQQDEKGHHAKQEKLAISRAAGDTAYVRVIPMLLGSVTFRFEAVFADGSVSSRDLTVPVGIPSLAPRQFRGDQFPEFSLSLQKGSDVAPLQPEAYYATIPDRIDEWGQSHPVAVDLSGRVDYQIVPFGAAPVVQLERDTQGSVIGVKALHPGTATIIAHFGSLTDQVQINVVNPQQ